MLKIKIIFEDNDFLAVDKPAGLIVNQALTTRGKETLQEWLLENIFKGKSPEEKGSAFSLRSGIVHRLDKDASGLLLVAKNGKSFLALQEQFSQRKVEKTYLVLVWDDLPKQGTIKVPVGRLPWQRRKFGIRLEGKPAETSYRIKEDFPRTGVTLLEVEPKTGRTHQIRVHFRYFGHPLVGDLLYGRRQLDRKIKAPRLFLHAHALNFFHPTKKERISLNCNLPGELAFFLEKLRKKE